MKRILQKTLLLTSICIFMLAGFAIGVSAAEETDNGVKVLYEAEEITDGAELEARARANINDDPSASVEANTTFKEAASEKTMSATDQITLEEPLTTVQLLRIVEEEDGTISREYVATAIVTAEEKQPFEEDKGWGWRVFSKVYYIGPDGPSLPKTMTGYKGTSQRLSGSHTVSQRTAYGKIWGYPLIGWWEIYKYEKSPQSTDVGSIYRVDGSNGKEKWPQIANGYLKSTFSIWINNCGALDVTCTVLAQTT